MRDQMNGDSVLVGTQSFVDEVRQYVGTKRAFRLFGAVFCRYSSESRLSKDDLMQDMALRCLEQAHHFKGGNIHAWAGKVAHRVVLNELRKSKYRREYFEYEDARHSNGTYARPDALVETMDVAKTLFEDASPNHREVLRGLIQYGGRGAKCAKALGINVHTVNGIRRKHSQRLTALLKG